MLREMYSVTYSSRMRRWMVRLTSVIQILGDDTQTLNVTEGTGDDEHEHALCWLYSAQIA